MKLLHLLAAAFVTVTASTAVSQTSPLAGRWQVEYQRGLRNENGDITVIMGKALLTLEQRGDSLVGLFTPEPGDDGRTPPPLAFAAKAGGASATFNTASESRITLNEEVRVVKVSITWALTAEGDALSGTMQRSFEGMEMPSEPAPVKGTRVR